MESIKKLAGSSVAVFVALAAQAAVAEVAIQPQAIDLEPFSLVPVVVAQLKQDDNIYLLHDGAVSSSVLEVNPSLNLISNDRENSYSLRYAMDAALYGEDKNNYIDHVLAVNAHVEPTGRFRFDLGAGYSLLHDDLGTGFTSGFNKAQIDARSGPDTYALAALNGGVEYGAADAAGQLALNLGFDQKRYDQSDVAASRDLDDLNGLLEFRMRVMPKTRLLLDYERGEGNYANNVTSRTFDYTDNSYLVGAAWTDSASTSGKVRLGSGKRDLASGQSLSSFRWDLGVVWTPLQYSQFTLDGYEHFADGVYPSLSVKTTSVAGGWKHDWSDRWQSVASLELRKDDHDVVAGFPKRQDDTTTLGVAVNYQMRRWLLLGGAISMARRSSDISAYEYNRNILSLNVQASL